jgi:pimeloyl-ACP methyl ester carboxylesterase
MTERAGLAYSDEGTGRPVVFLHGVPANREHWAPVTDILQDRYRCVRVDLPGHGESPDDHCDTVEAVGEVHAVVQSLGLEAPVVVGHSAGGIMAALYAAFHQPRAAVSVDGTFDLPRMADEFAIPWADHLRGDGVAEAVDALVAYERIDLVPEPRRSFLRSHIHHRSEVINAYWGGMMEGQAGELQEGLEGVMARIEVPFLAFCGQPLNSTEQRALGRIPKLQLEEWDDLGHFLHIVDPERFVERLTRFIQEVDDGL